MYLNVFLQKIKNLVSRRLPHLEEEMKKAPLKTIKVHSSCIVQEVACFVRRTNEWTVMSQSYREQRPLLYDDLSEEEFSPRCQRHSKPMVYKGRARIHARGAAAIFRLWPDHWSSSVTYWWIGIVMIGLITFVVYNSVVVFSMLPPVHFNKETKLHPATPTYALPDDKEFSFNIYMHLFLNNNQEIDLNDYMPYIDIFANKYTDFKFHLIVVFNDTSTEAKALSAEENNELALDLLWAKNSVHHAQKNNVVIEHVALSKYMNNSPLKRNWKKMPKQFIEFLTRAVSIWDKGGIAINPMLLTPRSPHAVYIEKFQNILKSHHQASKLKVKERKINKEQHNRNKKRVNNIRDIIEALEHEDDHFNDNSANNDVKDLGRLLDQKQNQYRTPQQSTINITANYQNVHPKLSHLIKNKLTQVNRSPELQETLEMAESKISNVSEMNISNETSAIGILPMFLDFLFRNKPNSISTSKINSEDTIISRKRKHAPIDNIKVDKSVNGQSFQFADKKISDKIITTDSPDFEKSTDESFDGDQFTVDLKGNMVSSRIPCHAFLGTMFSNAIHHTQESLTDFIITELSIFCKGALSSCKGIDVILL